MKIFWFAIASSLLLSMTACRPAGMKAHVVRAVNDRSLMIEENPDSYLMEASPKNEPTEASSFEEAIAGESYHDSAPLPTPESDTKNFVFKGELAPTIYYQPLLVDNEQVCDISRREPMLGAKGVQLIRVCPQNLEKCSMEGSCRIIQNGMIRSFNVLGGRPGFHTFFELTEDDCMFGFGVNSICLDPFYTVAADLHYYKAGDVIFVPSLVGGILPSGELHSGYLVVRDRGAGIKGPDRFDFFTGTMDWQDPQNPFAQAKLGDPRTRLPYYSVKGEVAQRFLQRRQFPRMPSHP